MSLRCSAREVDVAALSKASLFSTRVCRLQRQEVLRREGVAGGEDGGGSASTGTWRVTADELLEMRMLAAERKLATLKGLKGGARWSSLLRSC